MPDDERTKNMLAGVLVVGLVICAFIGAVVVIAALILGFVDLIQLIA